MYLCNRIGVPRGHPIPMTQLQKLRSSTTIHDVAALLGYTAKAVAYILYKKPPTERYYTFSIPKKFGGERIIDAPSPELKLLQRRLSDLLQNCQEDFLASPNRVRSAAHGFVRERSIISNAYPHRHRKYVFNLDLHDFFGSINFGRVRGYFISDRNFQLHPKVATILAQIACHNNRLPQGSPCSPIVSNLIGHILDTHLIQLAKKHGLQYTRYADDITFSTNKQKFPVPVAELTSTGNWQPGTDLRHLILHSGFSINDKKTRMQYRTSRQQVTGLVVNQKVNISSSYRRLVRAMTHRLLTSGSFEVNGVLGTIDQLHGMLGFINSIDLHNKKLLSSPENKGGLSKKEFIYRDFLLFKEFFSSPQPVIICEGKTDNIYLKLAINALAHQFPLLADIDKKGTIKRKVRIYRYADTSTGRILKIHGGTGELGNLIKTYIKVSKKFKLPSNQQPFIFLVDNDSGSVQKGGVFPAVRSATNNTKQVDRIAPYTYVSANLFVVPTPLLANDSDSEMEDFFDDTTKSIIINGKSFSSSNNFDKKTQYGKHDFSQKVILANSSKIDFNGFSKILENISAVIDLYSNSTN